MTFIISHGPDQEWFNDEAKQLMLLLTSSVELGGETITVSRVHQGQTFPHLEVFA